MLSFICFFFFFQAEDGIRDVAVTGVQTCALPISSLLGFFTQNFGLGNFSKRNSFGAGGLPENDTFPSTVPPAHVVMGAARNATAITATAVNTPSFFMAQTSLKNCKVRTPSGIILFLISRRISYPTFNKEVHI